MYYPALLSNFFVFLLDGLMFAHLFWTVLIGLVAYSITGADTSSRLSPERV